MRRLVIGDCRDDNVYQLVDPTAFLEIEFEAEVVRVLACTYPDYWCGVFAGAFVLEEQRRAADLAMIHKSFSHWFVVEVELAGHSLDYHVLPQVRCFRYGEPDEGCVTSLMRAFNGLDFGQAANILHSIPRHVAVVGNLPNAEWTTALHAVDAQYLTVSIFRNRLGQYAHEVEGQLIARAESLGFAEYSAIDKSLRIAKASGLPEGQVRIVDQFGNPASWTIRESGGVLWISKNQGPILLDHECYVQIIRVSDGTITLRLSEPR